MARIAGASERALPLRFEMICLRWALNGGGPLRESIIRIVKTYGVQVGTWVTGWFDTSSAR